MVALMNDCLYIRCLCVDIIKAPSTTHITNALLCMGQCRKLTSRRMLVEYSIVSTRQVCCFSSTPPCTTIFVINPWSKQPTCFCSDINRVQSIVMIQVVSCHIVKEHECALNIMDHVTPNMLMLSICVCVCVCLCVCVCVHGHCSFVQFKIKVYTPFSLVIYRSTILDTKHSVWKNTLLIMKVVVVGNRKMLHFSEYSISC